MLNNCDTKCWIKYTSNIFFSLCNFDKLFWTMCLFCFAFLWTMNILKTKRNNDVSVLDHTFMCIHVGFVKIFEMKWHSESSEWHTEKMLMPKNVIAISWILFLISACNLFVCRLVVHMQRSFILTVKTKLHKALTFYVQYAFILLSIWAFSIIYISACARLWSCLKQIILTMLK